MPTERYRDPLTGRWVTRETAGGLENVLRELFGSGPRAKREQQELLQEGEVATPFGNLPPKNWYEDGDPMGYYRFWTPTYPGDLINRDALPYYAPPPRAVSFRLRYSVPNNPDYPTGFASSDTLYMSSWPPSPLLGNRIGAAGIARIDFRVR